MGNDEAKLRIATRLTYLNSLVSTAGRSALDILIEAETEAHTLAIEDHTTDTGANLAAQRSNLFWRSEPELRELRSFVERKCNLSLSLSLLRGPSALVRPDIAHQQMTIPASVYMCKLQYLRYRWWLAPALQIVLSLRMNEV